MTGLVTFSLGFGFVALTVALIACFARALRGPSLADRVLAVDVMTVAGAGVMGLMSVQFHTTVLLDIALFLLVTGFVGTAAFAQFIERQQRQSAVSETPAESAAEEM